MRASSGAWRRCAGTRRWSASQSKRHRAIGVGSTRAEIQQWRVNLDRMTAQCERSRNYRQARRRAEGVRIEPVASELADNIITARADQPLKWHGDETVRILMAKIFPYDSGFHANGDRGGADDCGWRWKRWSPGMAGGRFGETFIPKQILVSRIDRRERKRR
jgi:hypothetical protein